MMLRPFVQWIAIRLEQTLRRNDNKGPWETVSLGYLEGRLLDELFELHYELIQPELDYIRIKEEALDVIAMAGMIAARVDTDMAQLRRGREIRPSWWGVSIVELTKDLEQDLSCRVNKEIIEAALEKIKKETVNNDQT